MHAKRAVANGLGGNSLAGQSCRIRLRSFVYRNARLKRRRGTLQSVQARIQRSISVAIPPTVSLANPGHTIPGPTVPLTIPGPYRIMWGNLVEQYPHLISSIHVINAPAFINVLWSACASFIGDDYRRRVHIHGAGWREHCACAALPPEALPVGEPYGGTRAMSIRVGEN